MSDKNFVTIDADASCNTNGDNTIIAAVADRRIYVWKIWLVASGAVNATFKDGSTALNSIALDFAAAGQTLSIPYDGEPIFKTTMGNAFKINLSGAVAVVGRIYYTYEQVQK